MKTLFFSFLLLLQPILSFSQTPIATIKGDFDKPDKIVLKKDSLDHYCTYFRQLNKDLYFITGQRGDVLNQFELPRTYPDKTYYGGFATGKEFILLFKDNNLFSPSLEAFAIPVTGKEVRSSKTELPNKGAQLLAAISNHNSYHLIYLLSKERKVQVMEFKDLENIKTYNFNLSKKQFNYLKNENFKAIKPYQEYDARSLTIYQKIYITDNERIAITIDNKYKAPDKTTGNTKMLVLTKESLNVEEKDFPLVNKKFIKSSSFYLDEMLYKVALNKKLLGIYVYKVSDGGKTISSREYHVGQLSEVIGNGAQKEATSLLTQKEVEVKERKALKLLSKGELGTAVEPL